VLSNVTSTNGGYTTPGARIRLNRPLPPYPHQGLGVTPPYTQQPTNNTQAPYGVAYNLTTANVANQYLAALTARQALANDIYRRLLAIAGIAPVLPANQPAPLSTDLAPRRWLAQLAVNIVDFIDEDDISTPFNFYTMADGLAAASLGLTQGNDDLGVPVAPESNLSGNNQTGANPLYWVFGTELPKVVLNEVLAEAVNPVTTAAPAAAESVKVWAELFNTMPATGGTNTQPQDTYRVPLYMTNPAGGAAGGYSPYRITIAQTLMNQPPPGAPIGTPGKPNYMPDASANVLGKAYIGNGNSPATLPLPQSTTDYDFSPTKYPNGVTLSQDLTATPPATPVYQTAAPVPGTGNTINAGVDPQNYFLIGPQSNLGAYQNPFVSPGLPANIPVVQADTMTYTPTAASWPAGSMNDERTTGLTVMLRRLANPYLPFNPNPTTTVNGNVIPNPTYNPYVTVDYIQNVPIQNNTAPNVPAGALYASRGKTQPYAGLTLPSTINTAPSGSITKAPSPVTNQIANATAPPPGAAATGLVYSTFGYANYPLPPSAHYDWLVFLDRPPISPLELLHVPAYQPYQLTQRFMLGSDNISNKANALNPANTTNAANMFGHYAPWLDAPPAAAPASGTLANMVGPWWFDGTMAGATPPTSHRLYRLFEFLECGDRALGVNGLGRIPGKVNINTIWDPEILQALVDANQNMNITPTVSQNPPNAADPIANIFNNLIQARSPNAKYNMTTGTYTGTLGPVNIGSTGTGDDHPFLPLSTGLSATPVAGTQYAQYPNGVSVTTDTLLRLSPNGNTLLALQNPNDTQATHPYLQTQILTKLFNNVTTRSNTFAIFLTVGFFQVTNNATTPPTLGAEIGRSEGRQVRHRMFAIVDRTNLSVLTTSSQTAVTGPLPNSTSAAGTPYSPTGQATVQLNLTTMNGVDSRTGVAWSIQPGMQLVADPGTVNEETVTVQAVNTPPGTAPNTANIPVPNITASFTKAHATGFALIQRGNPGPWNQFNVPYDPRKDPFVVLHFSIID
jgi:hypothetical protein